MRVGHRTLACLALCAAAAGAAIAHVAIDVVGDYALPTDTYDHLSHASRDLVSGVAFVLAVILAGRGLRACCDIAAAGRCRIPVRVNRLREGLALVVTAVAGSALLVPSMEWLDGRLDGVAVRELDDAFGGSLLLGLGTTIACAGLVALAVYAFARWLISQRDSIVAVIETLLRRSGDGVRPSAYHLAVQRFAPRRRRTPHALRLSKRGPPEILFA